MISVIKKYSLILFLLSCLLFIFGFNIYQNCFLSKKSIPISLESSPQAITAKNTSFIQ